MTDSNINWMNLRSATGSSGFVPTAVERMMHAKSADEASAGYWELDNHIVIQGQLFEAAEPTVVCVLERVCSGDYTSWGLSRSLDLLVEIAYGEPDQSEIVMGNLDLAERCRERIADGLPCVIKLVHERDERVLLGVLDLVDEIETDTKKRDSFLASLPLTDWSPKLVSRAQELSS